MSVSKFLAQLAFGHELGAATKIQAVTHLSGPGTPAETDTIPEHIGQDYFDTVDRHWWRSCGPTQFDWKKQTSDNP